MLKSKYFLQIVLFTSFLLMAPQKEPHCIKPAKNHLEILNPGSDIPKASVAAPKPHHRTLQKTLPEKREGLIPFAPRHRTAPTKVSRDCNGNCWTLQHVEEVYMKWYDGGAITANLLPQKQTTRHKIFIL